MNIAVKLYKQISDDKYIMIDRRGYKYPIKADTIVYNTIQSYEYYSLDLIIYTERAEKYREVNPTFFKKLYIVDNKLYEENELHILYPKNKYFHKYIKFEGVSNIKKYIKTRIAELNHCIFGADTAEELGEYNKEIESLTRVEKFLEANC